jgi:hypothetical protein
MASKKGRLDMPFSHNVERIGYHPLDDRPAFKFAMQETDGRFFLFIAHLWEALISIVDVTDPAKPEVVWTYEGPGNTWSHQVQVADGLMITNLEHRLPAWGYDPAGPAPEEGLLIWDVKDPRRPTLLGRWNGFGNGTHRNFYDGGRYVHATASRKGYRGKHYVLIDIADPSRPVEVGAWWIKGQREDEGVQERYRGRFVDLHGPPYAVGSHVVCPWSSAGLIVLDISDPTAPAKVGQLDVNPPLGSRIALHTVIPSAHPNLWVLNSEALNERCDEPVNFAGIVDLSKPEEPRLISLFPTPAIPDGYPVRDFIGKGGRFGPHNQHHPQGNPSLMPADRYVYLTYFNAGLQIYDVANPYFPKIVGYFIDDDPTTRLGPLPTDLVTQYEDVLVDRRGYAYVSEKNSGLHVLRFKGHADGRPQPV